MLTTQLSGVIRSIRRASLLREEGEQTDGQLLECYIQRRDESAFAALVHRHGPMVWGVCRRVLRGHQDAEDAFQATFLVLARKAASVLPRDLVANWLYGVAQQTAHKARALSAKRGARERQVTAIPEPASRHADADDLGPVLDRELARLPDKYRAVIVLCDLEGKTRKEAARHFRVPEGTVASRLATARGMLAKRLARSGVTLSTSALAAVLAQQAASANMPLAVASTTIQAALLFGGTAAEASAALSSPAATLAKGVLKTMLLTKLKIVTATLMGVAVVSAGVVAFTQQVSAEPPTEPTLAKKTVPTLPPGADKDKKPAADTPAAKPAAPPPTHAAGVVKAVNAEQRSITIEDKGSQFTFTLVQDAHVSIDGQPGKLADIPNGAHVMMDLTPEQAAHNLSAQGRSLFTTVTAVDLAQRRFTLRVPGGDKSFAVCSKALIRVDDKPGTLADIPPGSQVCAIMCVHEDTAWCITASGPSVFAAAKAVNVAASTITVAGPDGNDKTYAVAPDTTIRIDGKPGTLAGIPAGASLHALNLRVDQQTARDINVEGPALHHLAVRMVYPDKNAIAFDDKGPIEVAGKMLTLLPEAQIFVDGKPATLAALPPGAFVNINLTVDQNSIRRLDGEGPSLGECGGSMVKLVDPDKNTITFDDKAPVDIAGATFTIAKDASIQIDGRSGTLRDLPSGAYVNLTLTVDQTVARSLHAQGPRLTGVVKATDAAKATVTVDDNTYTVAPDAWIKIDARYISLAELPVGSKVHVNVCVDGKTIRGIQTTGS